jgi:pyruvate dehydrogenase E2 component (dihydrolipoamide acetyltransferase)
MARDKGLDLTRLEGSGPGGRVIAADVEAALTQPGAPVDGQARATAPAQAAPQAAPEVAPGDDVEEVPLSNLRKVVARRMLESVQTAPHFFLTTRVDVEALLVLREQLNAQLEADKRDLKLSLNDLLVKACALALRAEPDANVSFAGDKILRYKRAHVGIAVATDRGLVVPVLRDADRKSLGELAREARELIEKARAGRLTPDDYSGGTFTISNLGMYDVEHFLAIINPPQAAILAVGAALPEVVPWNGQPAVRRTMRMTLSVDHRALDGASGAKFLRAIKDLLEAPSRLVIQTEGW